MSSRETFLVWKEITKTTTSANARERARPDVYTTFSFLFAEAERSVGGAAPGSAGAAVGGPRGLAASPAPSPGPSPAPSTATTSAATSPSVSSPASSVSSSPSPSSSPTSSALIAGLDKSVLQVRSPFVIFYPSLLLFFASARYFICIFSKSNRYLHPRRNEG